MNVAVRLRKRTRILVLIAAIVGALGVAFIWGIHTFSIKPIPTYDVRKSVDIPDSMKRPMVHTIHLEDSIRAHLLDGNFSISARSRDVSTECNSIAQTAFQIPGISKTGSVEFAENGQPFQSSDKIAAGLPFRQLLFTGANERRCFLYYQHGGVMYPRFCLVVMDLDHKKVLWAGEERSEAHDLVDLRRMLRSDVFDDGSGWSC